MISGQGSLEDLHYLNVYGDVFIFTQLVLTDLMYARSGDGSAEGVISLQEKVNLKMLLCCNFFGGNAFMACCVYECMRMCKYLYKYYEADDNEDEEDVESEVSIQELGRTLKIE